MYSQNLIILVAMTVDRVIGQRGKLPWAIPEDLALFRRLTFGHTLVMGRRTFESIGRPLPGRKNIVVSSTMLPMEGVIVCPDFPSAVEHACQDGGKVFFIGGREIYRQALPLVGRLSVSWIKREYEGDCWFPDYRQSDWLIEEEGDYPEFYHAVYRRKGTGQIEAAVVLS